MSIATAPQPVSPAWRGWAASLFSAEALIVAIVPLACLLLSLPLYVPLGPNYWDLAIFVDANHRIGLGQIPNVDFRTPAGPLTYYLYAFASWLFPQGHPALVASWSSLIIVAPLMLLAIRQMEDKARHCKYWLVLPFVMLALLPFNTGSSLAVPGIDAYGIYNRQPVLLLYVLMVFIIIVKPGAITAVAAGAILLTLFLLKITGFIAGLAIAVYALMAGRMTLKHAALMLAALCAPLAVLEFWLGLTSAYLAGVAELVELNKGTFASRLAYIASIQFDIQLALAAIWLLLVMIELPLIKACWRNLHEPWTSLRSLLQLHSAWFSISLAAAVFFEIQNTGSQEYVFLWPVLVWIAGSATVSASRLRQALMLAMAFAVIPVAVSMLHKAGRTLIASTRYAPMEQTDLGAIARVTTRQAFAERARVMASHFGKYRSAYEELAQQGHSPSIELSLEPDFQFLWLMQAGEAMRAILAHETRNNMRFASMIVLDFADPVTAALGRDTPRHVQIGRDPDRTIPALDSKAPGELHKTEAILVPACPQIPFRNRIVAKFISAIEGRERIALTPCWDLYVNRKAG